MVKLRNKRWWIVILFLLMPTIIYGIIPWKLMKNLNIVIGYGFYCIFSYLLHLLIYRKVLSKLKIENRNKGFLNSIDRVIYKPKEYLKTYLSIDYLFAYTYKDTLMYLRDDDCRDEKSILLKKFNIYNLVWSLIFFLIASVFTHKPIKDSLITRFSEKYFILFKIQDIYEMFKWFIIFRTLFRCTEIIIAFYYDVVEKTKKTSSLTNSNRIKLAIHSLIEIIFLYGMSYHLSGIDDTIWGNLIRSFGLSTFTDIDLTYYSRYIDLTRYPWYIKLQHIGKLKDVIGELKGVSVYDSLSSIKLLDFQMPFVNIKMHLDVRFLMVLQIITSMVLIILAVANYMGSQEDDLLYLNYEEKEKISMLNSIEAIKKLNILSKNSEIKNKLHKKIEDKYNKKSEETEMKNEMELLNDAFDIYEEHQKKENNKNKQLLKGIQYDDIFTEKEKDDLQNIDRLEKLLLLNEKISDVEIYERLDISKTQLEKYREIIKSKSMMNKERKIYNKGIIQTIKGFLVYIGEKFKDNKY